MSEHCYLLFSGAVSARWCEAAGKAAKPHGGRVVTYDDPARGPRGWFVCRNMGAPFDDQTARAVEAALIEAGLWDGGPVREAAS